MATKTISIDMAAYNRLSAARLSPKDSFSQVIHRAQWQQKSATCADLLEALHGMPFAEETILQQIESAQHQDLPPDNPWA